MGSESMNMCVYIWCVCVVKEYFTLYSKLIINKKCLLEHYLSKVSTLAVVDHTIQIKKKLTLHINFH